MPDSLFPEPRALRDYQSQAIERLRDSLRTGHKHPILQAPTGAGKTYIASSIVRMARRKNKRVVFVVPALSLIDQTLDAFRADGIYEVGVIQANHIETDWSRPVQVASIQTIAKRGFPESDLVIVDESHIVHKTQIKWMEAQPSVPFIGLSATPWTRGLGKIYDDLIIAATTKEMIDVGRLCKFRVFAPSHPDLTGVKVVAGDYHEGQLSQTMNQEGLVADIVDTWVRKGENRPTLVFAVDRAHAQHLQEKFCESGINAAYQDAFTDSSERAGIKRGFHNGSYPVVCNVGTLTTGVDWDVRCIVLARPTRSEILYVQIIGRGLRPKSGSPEDCLILDHSDTALRLGFVTDIHHKALSQGGRAEAKSKGLSLPKECPNCSYLMPARVSVCPACGYKKQKPRNQVYEADGELYELTAPGKHPRARVRVPDGYISISGQIIPEREFYLELKGYAAEKRYKPGWPANVYREKCGKWPGGKWRWLEPLDPSVAVRGWVHGRNVRYLMFRNRKRAAPIKDAAD